MSAICGIVRFDGKPVGQTELQTMVESSPYRGPDGNRCHLNGNAGFAHLAFHLTPESVFEQQPLISADKRFVLTADVRLDNRDELLRKLGKRRDNETVITDPDLLMDAWLKWGKACVEHLKGDFVFSVWDSLAKSLFLARDPLGAYCVHYHDSPDGFVFASEIAAILDLPFVHPSINEDTILRSVEFLPRNHEQTLFNDIFYLPPAHCMEISGQGMKKWRYWDIDPEARASCESDGACAEHLLELLNRAVKNRLSCIGPAGVSLSGGRDSTLVAACAARVLHVGGAGLKSFSYVFDEHKVCDERDYIEAVNNSWGLDAHYMSGDELWTFRNLATHPVARDFLWTNCFMNLPLAVSSAAQQAGCRLLLDGHFGDALLSGSNLTVADLLYALDITGLFSYVRQHPRQFDWKRDMLLHGIGPLAPAPVKALYRRLRHAKQGPFIAGLTRQKKAALIHLRNQQEALRVPGRSTPGFRRRYRSLLNASWAQGFAAVRAPLYNRFGLEQSSPLYDVDIVTFILSLPESQISRPGQARFLQTNTMRKVLPETVCERSHKTVFTPLVQAGLLDEEKETVSRLLQNPQIVQQGWVMRNWLANLPQAAMHDEKACYALSNCLHLELWLRAIHAPMSSEGRWSDAEPPAL